MGLMVRSNHCDFIIYLMKQRLLEYCNENGFEFSEIYAIGDSICGIKDNIKVKIIEGDDAGSFAVWDDLNVPEPDWFQEKMEEIIKNDTEYRKFLDEFD